MTHFFFWSAPVAFRRVALETPEWTSRDSNHHRQSVSAGKTNAIPTEPSGRLYFHDDPQHENTSQMERWSLNQAPTWTASPVAIANRHYNANDQLVQNTRYRLILAKASNFDWLIRDKHAMRDLRSCQRRLGCLFFLAGALCLSAGHHLRLTRGPAGNRTTTGSLSASSRTTPYQLSHEDTSKKAWVPVQDLSFMKNPFRICTRPLIQTHICVSAFNYFFPRVWPMSHCGSVLT